MFKKSAYLHSLFLRTMSSQVRKLEGKVAVVTASTDGIGYAIANKLACDGARVMISSRKLANVEKALSSLRDHPGNLTVEGTTCHVAKPEDRKRLIQETIDKFGRLDILVSNAAANPSFGPILETQESAWDKIFDVNVKSAVFLVKEGHPHLKKNGGCVVFVSSVGGYTPFSLLSPYSISKTALLGLTRVFADELAPDGIRVNCIAPGVIKTRFSSALWQSDSLSEEFLKTIPMRRFGEPDECAGAVSFLCSDDARYITGETIVISGGMKCRL